MKNLPYCTTISGAMALVEGLQAIQEKALDVTTLQEYHED